MVLMLTTFIQRFAGSRPVMPCSASQLTALTHREMDVLRAVARGMSNAEIAARLFIAETTVKTHIARLLMKLSLRDRVQIVVFAYESGLVSTATPDSAKT
jgi:DNA-binding NarL/FixJ family response regulator